MCTQKDAHTFNVTTTRAGVAGNCEIVPPPFLFFVDSFAGKERGNCTLFISRKAKKDIQQVAIAAEDRFPCGNVILETFFQIEG